MAQIAGLSDFREHGPPGDVGTFIQPTSAVVFQFTFSGITTYAAMRIGISGWVLIDHGADPATVINTALSAAGTHDVTLLMREDWVITTTLSIPIGVYLHGLGWKYSLNYNAVGNCITITGDNVKIRDLKIDIVAGAGGGGARPNCILANARTNLEITKVWLVGDNTVGYDGSDVRQCGIVFTTVTYSRIALCRSNDHIVADICFSASVYNTVTGNTCIGTAQRGIYLIAVSNNNTVTGNTCQGKQADGINLNTSAGNIIEMNICIGNGNYGIIIDNFSDFNKVSNNYTSGNAAASIRVNNANCDGNQIEFNTVEDGAPSNIGTTTRSYGNYDPSANVFVGSVGIMPTTPLITFYDNDLTPSVAGSNVFLTAILHGGARDISMFDDGVEGQRIIIISSNPGNPTTIKDAGDLLLTADWTDGANKTLELVFDGADWRELSRV